MDDNQNLLLDIFEADRRLYDAKFEVKVQEERLSNLVKKLRCNIKIGFCNEVEFTPIANHLAEIDKELLKD